MRTSASYQQVCKIISAKCCWTYFTELVKVTVGKVCSAGLNSPERSGRGNIWGKKRGKGTFILDVLDYDRITASGLADRLISEF